MDINNILKIEGKARPGFAVNPGRVNHVPGIFSMIMEKEERRSNFLFHRLMKNRRLQISTDFGFLSAECRGLPTLMME